MKPGSTSPVYHTLKVGLLSKEQKALVLQATNLYVKDLKSNEVQKILVTYTKELDDTHIVFSGNKTLEAAGNYFRIDGTSLWIAAMSGRRINISTSFANPLLSRINRNS